MPGRHGNPFFARQPFRPVHGHRLALMVLAGYRLADEIQKWAGDTDVKSRLRRSGRGA